MKKGGRSGHSKSSKQRKHIEIKQSREISPIKQLIEGEESRVSYPLDKSQKIVIPHLNKSVAEFSPQEIQNLSNNADSLISVEIMRASIKKEELGLQEFYKNCPPFVEKIFKKALKNMESSLNLIRQERIQRMKQDTLIFVPPDKDYFQKQKGQTLNNWIKQTMQHHKQKQNFEKQSEAYNPIYQKTSQRICKLSQQIHNSQLDKQFQKLTLKTNERNETLITNKKSEIKNELLTILEASDRLRRLKQQEIQRRKSVEIAKQLEKMADLRKKYDSPTMRFFSIEDYFY